MKLQTRSMLIVLPLTMALWTTGDNVIAQNDIDSFLNALSQKCAALKQEAQSVAASKQGASQINSPSVPPYARTRVDTAVRQADALSQALLSVADRGNALIMQAKNESNIARKQGLINEIRATLKTGEALSQTKIQLNVSLDQLKTMVQITQKAAQLKGETSVVTVDKAWENPGGGVYVNTTAEIMDLDNKRVRRAEYDIQSRSLILHGTDRTWRTPAAEPEIVAVLMRCLYGTDTRKEIAVSLRFDPIDMGRKSPGIFGHEEVIFGCSRLVNTKVGWLLLNAEELIYALWHGLDKEGTILTETLNYPSLIQLSFDHPATQQQFKPERERSTDMRVWITPSRIRVRTGRDGELQYEPIRFQMYSETIQLQSREFLRGANVPNPGADVFTSYFNTHFEKFVRAPLGTVEGTGRTILPLEELVPLAKTVSILKWIKAQEIPLETGWAWTYSISNLPTPKELVPPDIHDISMEIKGPISIYNEFGPSRIIDEAGHTLRIVYQENGRIRELREEGAAAAIPVNQ